MRPEIPDEHVRGGEMGRRIRSFSWGTTTLGPIEQWPQSLKTSVSLILNAQMPMWLGWGPEMLFFYNDAYVQVLSQAKHPWALGRPASEVWSEIWHICGPLANRVFRDRDAPFVEDVRLFMDRGGFLEEVYYSFSYSPIEDESGNVGGLFCPNTEVTAKLLNARRLRTLSELSAKALVEKTLADACASAAATLAKNSDDVPFALLYLADGGGQHATLEQQIGLGASEVTPATVALDSIDAPSPWPIAEVFASGRPRTIELEPSAVIPRGLADQPVRRAITLPITTPGRELPMGVLVAGVNPTRHLDREYETFYELIANQVATAIQNAVAVEEERRRADMLAQLDQAKTAFFSNVSHEFRTPLTLMIGPTEDALASSDRALQGASLETVYRNELRLLKLVNALLDFSRIEAGRMQATYEAVDLPELTADLASGFRSAIERAGLRFEIEVEPLVRHVLVDPDMWEKIVLNLLSNALKFTREGSIRVTLRRVERELELAVADTGTGIAAEELPRLFERFHRVENPAARTHEGSGIGLALVAELAKLQGGTVLVESTLGVGSTFRVRIPLRTDDTLPPARRARSSTARAAFTEEAHRWIPETVSGGVPAVGAEHVLLADDNADMRDYVRRLLADHWRVTAVADGDAALEAARRDPPDLVLTDVMMPGLDGFGLLEALRRDPRLSAIPIVLLSARAGDEARIEGLGAGADDYLVKPFSARELVARIRTHLALSNARRQAIAASRAKDEFLAMLGHELRNPLAPIVTAIELMKLRGTERTREVRTIERQVQHLTRLVDDLLDISRVTRGLIELKREKLSIRDVIGKAVEIASPLIEHKRHHLTLDVPGGLSVDGDATRLAQVFANLLTNSARYTPEGGRIRIEAARDAERVRVRVIDNGIGIPDDMLTRIFELFEQGRRGAARSEGGLGIGLALVRSLVQLHGGTVAASSPGPDRGSTFEVLLPAARGMALRPAVAPANQRAADAAGRRILVVDDNEDAAEMLSDLLRTCGHEVIVANDPAQALALASEFHPDTAILDIGLPVMDGYELGRRLRELGFERGLLIALTGYGQEQDRIRSQAAGFDAHLVKPINFEKLSLVLKGA